MLAPLLGASLEWPVAALAAQYQASQTAAAMPRMNEAFT